MNKVQIIQDAAVLPLVLPRPLLDCDDANDCLCCTIDSRWSRILVYTIWSAASLLFCDILDTLAGWPLPDSRFLEPSGDLLFAKP